MTEKEYNEAEGTRRSELWRISESPEKYKWFLEHPVEPTPALTFGQAAHKYILEPDSFDDEFAVAPNVDKRTKAGKDEWAEFCAKNEGKTIISPDDFIQIQEMTEVLKNHPIAYQLLMQDGESEVPLFWTDEDTGERCKVKLDRLKGPGGAVVVDYKTAASAQTDKFNADIYRYGYHLQAAMYTEAVMKARGIENRPDFIFVVQEKKAPYSVNVIQVTEDVMLNGYDKFRELIGILHECKELDNWYGYNGPFNTINEAYLPGWLTMGDEDE